MRLIILLLISLMLSCGNNNQINEKGTLLKTIPITTISEEAKEHFEEARILVQNGLNNNPEEHYKKGIELDSSFVRMYNYISIYSTHDSIKKLNHELAKKYKHLVSKEEQMLVDATEFRLNNPEDTKEEIIFELAKLCPDDKYLHHTICFLLFRKNPNLAIKAGKKAVEIDKNYGSGYNILGYAYMNNGELNKAAKAFDDFIRCEPKNGNPYDSKADLMLRLGKNKEALELKQKAYELDKSFDWIPQEIIEIKAKMDSLKNE
ncbi:tetratricopeptide repeat protein [Aquimarina sediminis]|uniref:tetratricopeptide repeat protein n=1 Tax=Aquimarina sediminis TaxID=2070536 RepID=UPI000FFF1BD2|nr:hypothetical protein [Aquimarina sediminis]